MRNRFFSFTLIALLASIPFFSHAQLYVSGFLPNPVGTDSTFEYIQIFATHDINFSQTPYTVVVNNNGFALSSGWVAGGLLTYAFQLSSGTVKAGESFFVGGTQKQINGRNSTDISGYSWLRVKKVSTEAGDGFGSPNPAGVVGNGGAHADGIAIFKGLPGSLDSTTIPIDAIFYGSVIEAARPATGGYTVPTNEFYHQDSGTFGNGGNTFLGPEAFVSRYIYLKGIYDTAAKHWQVPRVYDTLPVGQFSPASLIANRLGLSTMSAEIIVNSNGFIDDFGDLYLNDSFASSLFVSGRLLRDSLEIFSRAPFEIKIDGINYQTGSIKIAPYGSYIDNLPVFIRFRPTQAGNFTDTVFFRSPGATTRFIVVKGVGVPNPRFTFTQSRLSVAENGISVRVVARIAETNNRPWSAEVALGTRTASEFTDFIFASPAKISYTPGGTDSFVFNIPIANNNVADRDRFFTLVFQNGDPHTIFSPVAAVRVDILDDDYRPVNIGLLRSVDSSGKADSIGLKYEVKGVVHGRSVKMTPGGFQFTLIDRTGGIAIFSAADTFFYMVNEGDELTIRGRKNQLNGLTVLDSLTFLQIASFQNPREMPRAVTKPDESTESRMMTIRFARLVSPGGDWAAGIEKAINLALDTFDIAIANAGNPLIGTPKPTGFFDITGIGGQVDSTLPFTSGYRVYPRYPADVVIIRDTIEPFSLITPANNTNITIQGQPNQVLQFTWATPYQRPQSGTMLYEWMLSTAAQGFETPLLSKPSDMAGGNPNISITYTELAELMRDNGIGGGQTLNAIWTVKAYINEGTFECWSSDTFSLNLTREALVSVSEAGRHPKISLYPNPAKDVLNIVSDEMITSLQLFNMAGKSIDNQQIMNAKSVQIPLSSYSRGIFFIEIFCGNEPFYFKFAIE